MGCDCAGTGVRRMLRRHVGQVCWRWNHDRRQIVWKMWPHGNFLLLLTMSSRQMMQMLSDNCSSSGVASGYSVFMFWMARRESITSFRAFLKFLEGEGGVNKSVITVC